LADVRPFQGARYNPDRLSDYSAVIAPPYDVISDRYREELLDRHPHNAVRLVLSQEREGDSEADNKYTRAASTLRTWIADSILLEDSTDSFYVYDQTYDTSATGRRTRRGLIAAVRVEPWEKGIIRPHEQTFPKATRDRLQLLRASRANFSTVFGLYDDPEQRVESILRLCTAGAPDMEATDDDGVVHRVWRMDCASASAEVHSAFSEWEILIADGHHRYETALAYRNEVRGQSSSWTGEEPENFTLMTLVNLRSPGLTILPTHRLLHGNGGGVTDILTRAEIFFDIKELPATIAASQALDLLKQSADAHSFGFVTPHRAFQMTARPQLLSHPLLPDDKSEAYRKLDVTLLHAFILDPVLRQSDPVSELTYIKDAEEGVAAVRDGQGSMVFLLNATRLDEVLAVARAGEKMPHKATYFYPKVFSGIVMRKLS